jgi:hypothetical protein
MNTNKILSILIAVVLGWVGSLSIAQASVGANPNDYTTKTMLDRFDKVKADLYYASKVTGMDMGDLTAIASIESSLQANVGNKHSTASGMLQHTKGTWASDRRAYHAQLGVPANAKVTNPRASLLIGAGGLMDAKRFLVERTHLSADQVRPGDQYMTHFLGRDCAARVINSNSGTPMNRIVKISKGNRAMFVKPNGQVRTAREFRLYLDQIVKRERDFYAAQVKQYSTAKLKQDILKEMDNVDPVMAMAQYNTSSLVGWTAQLKI